MPLADQFLEEETLVRAFIYGHDKSLKTTWALNAAEAGYRVLFFDFNNGAASVARLSPEARKRVFILQAQDGPTDGFCSVFVTFALKNFNFYFNEEKRLVSLRPLPGLYHCDMRDFGRDTVVVFDSYTDIVRSLARRFAFENNLDLSQAEKAYDMRQHYGWCGSLATFILDQIKAMPCHTITIGHPVQYEKFKKDPTDPKKTGPLEWSRKQPISTSNPHGMTVTDKFDHVLQFYIEGRTPYIDARGSRDEAGGSRIIPPARYSWNDMQFSNIAALMGISNPKSVEPFNFPLIEKQQISIGGSKPQQAPVAQPAAQGNEGTQKPILQQTNRASIIKL